MAHVYFVLINDRGKKKDEREEKKKKKRKEQEGTDRFRFRDEIRKDFTWYFILEEFTFAINIFDIECRWSSNFYLEKPLTNI